MSTTFDAWQSLDDLKNAEIAVGMHGYDPVGTLPLCDLEWEDILCYLMGEYRVSDFHAQGICLMFMSTMLRCF